MVKHGDLIHAHIKPLALIVEAKDGDLWFREEGTMLKSEDGLAVWGSSLWEDDQGMDLWLIWIVLLNSFVDLLKNGFSLRLVLPFQEETLEEGRSWPHNRYVCNFCLWDERYWIISAYKIDDIKPTRVVGYYNGCLNAIDNILLLYPVDTFKSIFDVHFNKNRLQQSSKCLPSVHPPYNYQLAN